MWATSAPVGRQRTSAIDGLPSAAILELNRDLALAIDRIVAFLGFHELHADLIGESNPVWQERERIRSHANAGLRKRGLRRWRVSARRHDTLHRTRHGAIVHDTQSVRIVSETPFHIDASVWRSTLAASYSSDQSIAFPLRHRQYFTAGRVSEGRSDFDGSVRFELSAVPGGDCQIPVECHTPPDRVRTEGL